MTIKPNHSLVLNAVAYFIEILENHKLSITPEKLHYMAYLAQCWSIAADSWSVAPHYKVLFHESIYVSKKGDGLEIENLSDIFTGRSKDPIKYILRKAKQGNIDSQALTILNMILNSCGKMSAEEILEPILITRPYQNALKNRDKNPSHKESRKISEEDIWKHYTDILRKQIENLTGRPERLNHLG